MWISTKPLRETHVDLYNDSQRRRDLYNDSRDLCKDSLQSLSGKQMKISTMTLRDLYKDPPPKLQNRDLHKDLYNDSQRHRDLYKDSRDICKDSLQSLPQKQTWILQ